MSWSHNHHKSVGTARQLLEYGEWQKRFSGQARIYEPNRKGSCNREYKFSKSEGWKCFGDLIRKEGQADQYEG